MIISRLAGGLGNQMFQYAIARAYSLRTGYEFKVDTFELNRPGRRGYELDRFACHPARSNMWDRLKGIAVDERLMTPEHFTALNQDHLHLIGYWQNEGYFKDYAEQIRKDFTLKKPIESSNEPIVSVHIRKGDYAGHTLHPVQPLEYYEKAFEIIESEVKHPIFYLFSDDPIPSGFMQRPGRVVIPMLPHPAYLDLDLMKLCQHNVIANSSFSWWSAWLNENPDKIVIAPRHWFNGQEFGGYCPGWRVI